MPIVAQQIVTRALQECGAIGIASVADGVENQEAFEVLNAMVGQLQIQNQIQATVIERAVFDLVANQGGPTNPYTIGAGGNFNRFRPNDIFNASILDPNQGASGPLEIPIRIVNYQEYQSEALKNTTSTYPYLLYYQRSMPLGKIFLFPVPQVSTMDIALWLPTPLSVFADLATTTYDLPPGMEEMLVYNLALRLNSRYRLPVDEQLERWASQSLATLKRSNYVPRTMGLDPELRGQRGVYDWRSDTFR